MESVVLDTPAGISVRLGWDPALSIHDRRRLLARELVAAHIGVDIGDVRVDREAPQQFGAHTRLIASYEGKDLPITIVTTSFRAATVVAIADAGIPIGLDLRDLKPDESSVNEMQRHSHLLEETDLLGLLAHWTRVQAVLEADGRGLRVHPEHVRLDSARTRGWIRDRHDVYRLVDLSRNGWVITLAYGSPVAA